jgi:hypothetical protein
VTGMGKDFLARAAAQKIGVGEVLDLEKLCFGDASVYGLFLSPLARMGLVQVSPAVGVALMVAGKLEGRM